MEKIKNQTSIGKRLAFFLVFISSLFIMSCDKSETPAPDTGSMNNTNDRTATTLPVANDERPWTVMDINHIPGMGLLTPDYEVKMLSDRTVVFEGRHNTGTKGLKTFVINEGTYKNVITLFESADFLNLEFKVPDIIDAPEVFTTYAIRSHDIIKSHTLHDFNVIPESLISLRTMIEIELGIPALVKMSDTRSPGNTE